MRKLILVFSTLLILLPTARSAAHSAVAAEVVAAGRTSLLIVDAGRDRLGLVDLGTDSVKTREIPFTIESTVIYDDAIRSFRAFGRPRGGGALVLWSLHEVSGTLTSAKTSATRVEAFVKNPAGRLFARLRDSHNIVYAGRVDDRVNAFTKSEAAKQPEPSDVVLSGSDVVSSDGTVLVDGTLQKLSVPLSARNDRLWYETRLTSGWLLLDPMTGNVRWSRDGSLWEVRPSLGGVAFGTVMPYSVEAISDGSGAYVVSTIGNVKDQRRLLSRVDVSGNAIPVTEFGKDLGRLVAGPEAMWLVGGAVDERTIRFAPVTPSGIGAIRRVDWPDH